VLGSSLFAHVVETGTSRAGDDQAPTSIVEPVNAGASVIVDGTAPRAPKVIASPSRRVFRPVKEDQEQTGDWDPFARDRFGNFDDAA
jgi:hypothetical protein